MNDLEKRDLFGPFDDEEKVAPEKRTGKDPDIVNHPPHYTAGDIECIDAIKAATTGLNGYEGFCVGNAIKYLWRWRAKGGVTDLKKAAWYIDRLNSYAGQRKDAD